MGIFYQLLGIFQPNLLATLVLDLVLIKLTWQHCFNFATFNLLFYQEVCVSDIRYKMFVFSGIPVVTETWPLAI